MCYAQAGNADTSLSRPKIRKTPLCFDPDAEPGKTVYCVFEDETLLETVESLPITDNHGKPTIEVYRSNDDLFIADNYKNREL